MIDSHVSANDIDKKEEKAIQEFKEKKHQKRLRTSSANLHTKKHKKQSSSPTKISGQSEKNQKQSSQRSQSAKKPGLPVIFQEQRSNSNSLLPISALCWSVTDAVSGQQIYSKMSSEVREMASLTKMMTLYVCYQLSLAYNLKAESEEVIVPKIAAYTCGTSAFLRESEKLTLKDLYHALMLPSGNDAAVTLAHHFGQLLCKNPLQSIKVRQVILSQQSQQVQQHQLSSSSSQQQQYTLRQYSPERDSSNNKKNEKEEENRSHSQAPSDQCSSQQEIPSLQQEQRKKQQSFISRFVKEMNKYASKLGMRDSQFSNCHGLASKSNRSTCEDLSKVALNIIQIAELQQICSTKNYSCIIYHTIKKDIRKAEWINTNKLLWDESGQFYGVKTGCTDNAGPCLCVYYKDTQDVNIELIITVLCCKNPERRFEDSSKLARWAARQLKSSTTAQQMQQQSHQREQSQSNSNKFPFYNPTNSNCGITQRTILSKSNVFQLLNKNDSSSQKQHLQIQKSDLSHQSGQTQTMAATDRIHQLGRTISSFTQLNSFCNLNTSFITNNNNNSNNKNNNKSKQKECISPLLPYNDQNRINKFINSNISQIANHHFNLNAATRKDEADLTDRSALPPQKTSRGLSDSINQKSQQMTTFSRDRSIKNFSSNGEKNNTAHFLLKRIDDKIQLGNNSKIVTNNPSKIQSIISSLHTNNKGSIISNTSQQGINSSQSTTCSTTVNSQQVFSSNKNYQDVLQSPAESIGSETNIPHSTLLSPTTTSRCISINLQNNPDIQINGNANNNIESNLSNLSPPPLSSKSKNIYSFDSSSSTFNFLLNGGGIQYRSEIRDSIKKPIGGTNSSLSNTTTAPQNYVPLDKTDNPKIEESMKASSLSGAATNNNNNHNIKIFSKAKKKRYIISCLANIN